MNEQARRVRHYIYEHFARHGNAPVLEQVMAGFRLDREEALSVLKDLEAEHHLVLLPGTSRILMAHPFSAITTPFRVAHRQGRRWYANCAWDALAIHVSLGVPLRIESWCHHCAEPIEIELNGEQVTTADPDSVLVYLGLPAAQWWSDIIMTCSNTMLFFASSEHRDAWLSSEDVVAPGASLDLETSIALALPLYRRKLALDYERPGVEQLRAHFDSLGLGGSFWAL